MPRQTTPHIPAVPDSVPREDYVGDNCLIPELHHIGWTLYPEADLAGLVGHSHKNAFEICYMVRGTAMWWVEQDVLEVEPGELFITWPDEYHGGVDGAMHPCELYWLQIELPHDGAVFDMSADETRQLREAFDALSHRTCPGGDILKPHYDRILREHREPSELSPSIIRGCIRLLCADVLRTFADSAASENSQRHYAQRVQDAIAWLHAHMARPISVEDAAAEVGLKPSHFRDEFRRETGYSPIEFLTHLRLRAARERLLETDDSITVIAFDLGFNTSQYFSTVFKKHTGLSPTGYRRRRMEQQTG